MAERKERRAPTRADVARLAGTSLATVSYVINGGPKKVSAETGDKVRRAISELGYRPDPIARQLRGSESSVLGLLVPNLRGPFFVDLAEEIERQVRSRGKLLLIASTNFDPETEEELVADFLSRRTAAILSIGPTPRLLPESAEHGTFHGALTVMPGCRLEQAVSIGIDQREAARLAVQHLVDHGCRSVAAIFGPEGHTVFRPRMRGWRDVTGLDGALGQQLSRWADYSFSGGYRAAVELVRDGAVKPDGLFVSNDTQAVGALAALSDLRVQVPEDIAVVSIDAARISEFTTPALTTVEQPIGSLAQAALDVVEGLVPAGPRTVTVPHRLLVRDSCGCGDRGTGASRLAKCHES